MLALRLHLNNLIMLELHLTLLLLLQQTSRLEACRLSGFHLPEILVSRHWLWNVIPKVHS